MTTLINKFVFAGLLFIVSCNNKVIPLRNAYQEKPYQFSTAYSKEQVWNKLIDLFTTKGLAIKTIDKDDGLITSDNTSFLKSYSWENKDGSLTNQNAFVVCSKVKGPLSLTSSFKPTLLTGQWTIRIKPEPGKTVVDTKLVNASGKVVIENSGPNTYATNESYNLIVESTGVFEKSIEEALK